MIKYLKEMRAISDSYIKLEDKLKADIEGIRDRYSNLIDKTGMLEEIRELELKITTEKQKAINDIKEISAKAVEEIREWGRPTSEKIKDIAILQLNLDEEEVIDLLEHHKDNPVMVKELKKYASNKGMKKAPYLPYDTVDKRIERVNLVKDTILRGIEGEYSYSYMYIRNEGAMNKLIEG